MIDRKQVKLDVRAYLKGRWWPVFLAFFLVSLAAGAAGFVCGMLALILPILPLAAVFAVMPLGTSLAGYFLKFARGQNPELGDAFDCFNKRYVPYLAAGAWRCLWVILWSLLLFVPGIIKGIAYCFTDFIIYENPNIGAKKALKMSMAMTDGRKGELFVAYLSFFWWYMLCSITLGIAGIYVIPYGGTTFAVYYEKMKEQAIAAGKVDPADFYAAA